MATLKVTNLQNTAATVTNVSLLADGTTTLVLNATGTNRTGGLRYNAGNLEVYTSGGVWASVGGDGGGTVTGVTGTLPIVSTGGTAPILSINAATNATAGSMSAADKAKLDGAATIVSAVTGTAPISVATGTSTPVVSISAATTGAQGSIQLATAAEAATGTDASKAITPATGVPKDAATMTGAALIPGGNDAARPGTPVTGMFRYNSQSGTPVSLEYYNGAAWSSVGSNWTVAGSNIAPTTATVLQFNSGYGSNATAYGCRAWVNFNGVPASPTIAASGNVSSITKNSTGDYTLNFTTAMPDANYAVSATGSNSTGAAIFAGVRFIPTPPAVSNVRIYTWDFVLGTSVDCNFISVTITR